MAKKLSTDEILKMARKQDTSAKADASAPAPAAAEPAVASEAPVAGTPKPVAAAPKGTADILAAARAQKAGGATAAPKSTADILAAARKQQAAIAAESSSPVAPVTTASKATVAPANAPSVKEMLEQMKTGAKPQVAPAAPQLRLPTRPDAKPLVVNQSRRGVLLAAANGVIGLVATPFALAWTTLATTAVAWVLAVARFMFPNVLVEPPTRFKIGPPSDYPPGSVSTKWTAGRGIWVVHTDQYQSKDSIYALATVCTHLGCTPSWLDGEQKFKCPCHGSGFYITGINFEGPAPRPLERVGLRLAPDGMLEVDKSVKFQEEKGQWQDGKSFVDASLV